MLSRCRVTSMFSISRRSLGPKSIQPGLAFQITPLPIDPIPNALRWRYTTRAGDELLTNHPNGKGVESSDSLAPAHTSNLHWDVRTSLNADTVGFNSDDSSGKDNGEPVRPRPTFLEQDVVYDGKEDHQAGERNEAVPADISLLVRPDAEQRRMELEMEMAEQTDQVHRRGARYMSRRLLTPRQIRKVLHIPNPRKVTSHAGARRVLSIPRSPDGTPLSRAVRKPSEEVANIEDSLHQAQSSANIFWMDVLKLLWTIPVSKESPGDRAVVYLSIETITVLTGRKHQNLWVHPVRDGCQIHVQDNNHDFNGKRLVYLKGSPRAIDLTKTYLLRVEQSLDPEAEFHNSLNPVPSTTLAPDERPDNPRLSPAIRPSNVRSSVVELRLVEKPKSWNVRTFADHVEDLVAQTGSAHLKRILAKSGEFETLPGLQRAFDQQSNEKRHFHVIAARLEELFSDPKLQYCISTHAQDLAVEFLLKYYQLRPRRSLTTIFAIFSMRDRDAHARLWNRIFTTALKTQTLRFIQSLFDFARERDIPVYATTGLAILGQTTSLKVKMGVCQWLAKNNFLANPSIVRRFTATTIPDLCKSYFMNGGTARSLFAKMDQGIGSFWLSDTAISRMLETCAGWKFRAQAEEILDILFERRYRLQNRVVSHMAKLYYRLRDMDAMFKLLTSEWVRSVGRQDRYVIPYAFMTAWNTRCYNATRVLYHYAALRGVVTYEMRQVVYWSLVRNKFREGSKWEPEDPIKRDWKLTAAKVVAGVALDVPVLARKYASLVKDAGGREANPMHWIIHAGPPNREEQKSLVVEILRNDESAVVYFEPDYKLGELLGTAMTMDEKWKQEDVLHDEDKGLDWMVDNCIKVPSRVRDVSLPIGSGGRKKDEWDANEEEKGGRTSKPLMRQPEMVGYD